MHPLERFNKEEIITYALSLMDSAKGRLDIEDVEGAAWRLADALGALSVVAPDGTQGVHSFTGLGYKLQVMGDKEGQS